MTKLEAYIKSSTAKKGMIYVGCMEGPRERSGFERTSFTGESELYITYYPRTES